MKRYLSLLMTFLLICSLVACGKSAAPTWQEQYDLGVRYLSEGNYEEAIIAFTAAIEIDPKRAEAYISAADAYLNLGEFDKAEATLQDGYDATDDETIANLLEGYESGNYHSSNGRRFRMNGYNENGVLAWYHTYAYDAEGRESAVTSFDAAGNQTGHVDYVYDAEGRMLISCSWASHTGEVSAIERVYDSQGNEVEILHYEPNGELRFRSQKTFDAEGRELSEYWYGPDGTLSWYYEFEYVGEELWQREYGQDGTLWGYTVVYPDGRTEFYSAEGELTGYDIDIYDADGNHLGFESYDGEGNLEFSTVVESE